MRPVGMSLKLSILFEIQPSSQHQETVNSVQLLIYSHMYIVPFIRVIVKEFYFQEEEYHSYIDTFPKIARSQKHRCHSH